MDRKELVEKLKLVAPALSDKELIPVLTHFWFSGDTVMAFNDQIAIEVPCPTDFEGAVPGNVLLDMLNSSQSTEAKFTLTEDTLLVELGKANSKGKFATRTKLELKVLPVEDFIHTMPKVGKEDGIEGSDLFSPAIDSCMQSISNDTSIPDQLGLTIIPNGKELHLYATNNQTLSHARVKTDAKLAGRVILSKPFCEQLITLTDGVDFRLIIEDDHAMVITSDKVKLFGRLVNSEHPLDFSDLLSTHLSTEKKKQLIAMPKSLRNVLQRALIITDTKMEETKSLITVQDGKMTVVSKSARGELRDTVLDKAGDIQDHPDISVKLNPKLLKAGCDRYSNLLVTKTCAIMTKDDMVYLVSASN